MSNEKCTACGEEEFEERLVEFLYTRRGKHLFVHKMPALVCQKCGMRYYPAEAMKQVEKRFKAIYERHEKPDRYEKIPVMDTASALYA
jgi:YgiT-type zinc finger domain-containing protein